MTHFARGALCSLPLTGWLAAAEPPGKTTLEAEAELLRGFSIEQLMGIKVTTVTRMASTVEHSPAAIFVITPEMIRRSGATAIPELFRMVPGMNVARVDGSKWAVAVLSGQSVLIVGEASNSPGATASSGSIPRRRASGSRSIPTPPGGAAEDQRATPEAGADHPRSAERPDRQRR